MKSREPFDSGDENRSKTATTRRGALGLAGAVGLAGLAGCTALDVATGDEPAEFGAGTATVADATLSDTGYELNDVSDQSVTREFEVAGSTREVRVTNTIAEYDKAVELFGENYQAAVFAALATPRSRCSARRSTRSRTSRPTSAPPSSPTATRA